MSRTIPIDGIPRTGKGAFEVFTPTVTLTPQQREGFLKDPSKFLRKLFKRQGHTVNDFSVTTDFVDKITRKLNKAPRDSDVVFLPVVVHVVQDDAHPSRVSRYI